MENGIRPARREDLAPGMELIRSCVALMQAEGSDQWNESYPNLELMTLDLEEGVLYVCEEEGEVAGLLTLDEFASEEYEAVEWSRQEGRHLIMHRLAVHPKFQGRGIARRLIAFTEQKARSEGYDTIRLDTYAKNHKALSLYTSLGYELRGEIRFPGRTAPFPVFEKVLTGQ